MTEDLLIGKNVLFNNDSTDGTVSGKVLNKIKIMSYRGDVTVDNYMIDHYDNFYIVNPRDILGFVTGH